MAKHGYQQYCGLARALDVAGDRWTLLIVRDLLLGPRRFTDLLDGLPGISRNLLTERLRDLERDGVVVRQELPPPAARQVYELTDDGCDLADAMVPLVAWGAKRLGARGRSESFRPQWAAAAMLTFANRDAARGVNETYQYVIGRWAFHFNINDGSIQLRDGQAQDPAVTVTTDENTWADIASGKITGSAAPARRQLKIVGDRDAVARLKEIFSRDRVLAQAEATVSRVRQRR
jgi:DNA-binding HxlR family transcriptional regulator/putative sterol carrier protein